MLKCLYFYTKKLIQWPDSITVRTLDIESCIYPISFINQVLLGLSTQYEFTLTTKGNSIDCNPQIINVQLESSSIYGNLPRTDSFYGNMNFSLLFIGF